MRSLEASQTLPMSAQHIFSGSSMTHMAFFRSKTRLKWCYGVCSNGPFYMFGADEG